MVPLHFGNSLALFVYRNKAAESRSLRLFCGLSRIFGPSGAIRTRGLLRPRQAPYPWATPGNIVFFLAFLSAIIAGFPLWSSMWSLGGFSGNRSGGETSATPANKGLPGLLQLRCRPRRVHAPKAGALPTGLHPEI